jgi:hypothetical protein
MNERKPSRRELLKFAGGAGLMAIALESSLMAAGSPRPEQYPRNLTQQDIERWMSELSNWGKWGSDDQAGTINLISPAKRKAAGRKRIHVTRR